MEPTVTIDPQDNRYWLVDGVRVRRIMGGGLGLYAPGRLGPDTDVVNGQLVALQSVEARFPNSFVPLPQRVPNITPTVPPSMGMGVGGPSMNTSAQEAINNPWNLFHSPLPWAIAFLVIGLLGLRLIHWRP